MKRSRIAVSSLLLIASVLTGPLAANAGGLTFIETLPVDKSDIEDQGLRDASAVAVSSDNKYVFAVGRDGLSRWARDLTPPPSPLNGKLTFVEALLDDGMGPIDGTKGGWAIALAPASPDGTHVYVIGKADDAIAAFKSDATTGALTYLGFTKDDDGNIPQGAMRNPTDVKVSPDGKHVYVTSGQDQNVVAFTRNASTGALTWLATYHSTNDVGPFEGLSHPQSLALDPAGQFVYVGGHREVSVVPEGTVVTMRRDDDSLSPTFGQLTWVSVNLNPKLNDPLSLVVSGDSKNVYVASNETNAVVVFARDTDSMSGTFGELTFVEAQSNGGAASGLTETWGVAIDGLGKYVYATGRTDKGLAVFSRNATDGKLTFVEAHISPKKAPADPTLLRGMGGPRRLAVAPDGESLYVPGDTPGSLTGFSIDKCGNSHRGIDEECDPNGGFCISCQLVVCDSTPTNGCTLPVHTTTLGNAALAIKNDPTKLDTKDSMSWQWKKGNVPLAAAFGNPLSTADYVICVYDSSGNTQPLASRAIPKGGAEWTQKIDANTLLPKQFKYKSKSLRPDGIQAMTLTAGTPDKASIKIKGKGAFLRPPALASVAPGLEVPVTVVVRNTENTECWVATYNGIVGVDPKLISKNDETQFKGKSQAP